MDQPNRKRPKKNSNSTSSNEPSPIKPERLNSPTKRKKEMQEILSEMLKPLRDEICELRKQLTDKDNEIQELRKDIINLDSKQRSKNIKILNVAQGPFENNFDTRRIVLSILENSGLPLMHIDKAERVGYRTGHSVGMPIIVTFLSQADRDLILKKKDHMRKICNVFVEEDFPACVEDQRAKLKPICAAINNYEKNGKRMYRARLDRNKLIANSKTYYLETLDELPTDIKPENLFTQSNESVVGFFRKWSPLSNHHIAPQVVNQTTYNCNEQFYLSQKAKFFGDNFTARKIMNEENPTQQKQLAKKIENVDQVKWSAVCDRIMKDGLRAKFRQNVKLKEFLILTGKKTIIECNPNDKYWGVGMALKNKNIWTKKEFAGNRLGQLLMEIRNESV